MPLIGYARVSTDKQLMDSQVNELRAAGCSEVFQEQISGGSRVRPELDRAIKGLTPGDTLLVVRIDRLARSLTNLLTIIETIEKRGAFFRSLRDPIDTTNAHGKFALQVLGAAAEFERSLISERTKEGMEAAKARGSRSGNPGMSTRDPDAVRKISEARDAGYLNELKSTSHIWLPIVQNMRPANTWEDTLIAVNAAIPGDPWGPQRLVRAVKRLVDEGLADPVLLQNAPRMPPQDKALPMIVAMVRVNSSMSMREIGAQLEAMHIPAPRGGKRWSPSSVRIMLNKARQRGLFNGQTSQKPSTQPEPSPPPGSPASSDSRNLVSFQREPHQRVKKEASHGVYRGMPMMVVQTPDPSEGET